MAQAIIAQLRRQQPDVQIVFTHFSPSAERVAQRVGADVADYVPWDTPRAMQHALNALPASRAIADIHSRSGTGHNPR